MNKYSQLSLSERFKIYEYLKYKTSKRKIGRLLGRSHGTISREINRNSDRYGYLYPKDAHEQTQQRKAKPPLKIEKIIGLKDYIISKLESFWSPRAIAGRWSKETPGHTIQAETIYRYIYSNEAKALKLWRLLPKKRKKRGISRKRQTSSTIKKRVSIHKRPSIVSSRETFGHYEADLFFNKGSMSKNVLITVERKSRKLFLKKNKTKSTKTVIGALRRSIDSSIKSITFDNGTEFAEHTTLQKNGISTYFCDPGKPWQKGSVEQTIKVIRRFIPFGLSYQEISQDFLDGVANIINNTPRKSLNFLTPNEVFGAFYRKIPSGALQN